MNTAIKIPLHSLNPLVVKDLQDKYPSAIVHIEMEKRLKSKKMDEKQFWNTIALLDWGRKRNEDITAPAIEALSRFPEDSIFRFDQILSEKLYALDGERYAKQLGWGDTSGRAFSPDVFLYARCCAVANGKAFHEEVLHNPLRFPKEYTFEPILYLAEKAYLKKNKTNVYDFLSSISFETFSNHEGWPSMPPLSDIIKGKEA